MDKLKKRVNNGKMFSNLGCLIMKFISLNFIFFVALSFALSWIFKGIYRKLCILGLSFLFLSFFGNPIHWVYMIFIILYTHSMGVLISKKENKTICTVGVVGVIIGLCFFKYAGFFDFKNIIMPLGLSFYTFKSISYMVDLYNKKFEPVSLLDTAIYLSFFPVVSAGPIDRPKNFFTQLQQPAEFDYMTVKKGALLCALGLFQKMVFANFLFNVLIQYKSVSDELSGLYNVLAIIMYAFYIYIDFDGYSNLAIGCSRMLGFEMNRNFRTPYLASSIKEFWTRWHISLSTWLRDYIYVPLGGNRKGTLRKYLNTMIVFFISGLWHGSTFVFVVWGLGHGLLNVLEEVVSKWVFKGKKVENKFLKLLGILFNFIAVACLWVFFDAKSVVEAMNQLTGVFTAMPFSWQTLGMTTREGIWLGVVLLITVLTDCIRNKTNMIDWISNQKMIYRWSIYIVLIVVAIIFGVYGPGYNSGDFVYVTF